ncbi:DUF3817 domain-containing protein [Saccharopolyspora dendranthemae]|uniref:Uncharacterized protein DUF3817 n=1 Tax=Saccharopolyspora dendranthemae TaxID=1181886 RepID=A0A561U4R0_9PSEU|nr:DUF3817 domain-containing protein [Saccharopolyspora dendranthemae]TWF94350.1 uncharacterized protein DUF3817 [Saccharopolyspora dendranthemae]
MRALKIAAIAEALTLALLLVNLVTIHVPAISSLLGPLHGTAYLITIAAALTAIPARARWLALIPGVGGVAALARHQAE